jgi:hypothetical protein
MSELTVSVARPGIPGFIGAWPQSRLWLLCVDLYPALAAASLPWSTTAVSIFMVLWLLVVLPTVRWPEFFEALRTPASYLPLAFLALAAAGLLWTDDSWPVGIQGFVPVSKLLAVPLLLYHYERSERGHWVLFAFLAACVLLMGLSWVTYFADWKVQPGGVPVYHGAADPVVGGQRPSRVDLGLRSRHAGLLSRHAVCRDLAHGIRLLPDSVDPFCRQISEPETCGLFPAVGGSRRVRSPAHIALSA